MKIENIITIWPSYYVCEIFLLKLIVHSWYRNKLNFPKTDYYTITAKNPKLSTKNYYVNKFNIILYICTYLYG